MLLTVSDGKVIPPVIGEPPELFPRVPPAGKTAECSDLLIRHDVFLRRKFPGNELLIGVIAHLDLFLAGPGILIAVYGIIPVDDLIRDEGEDARRVDCVVECLMELAVIFYFQEIDRILERPPFLSRLKCNRKKLLDILIVDRARQKIFHIIKCHVPLQLREIRRPPGAEAELIVTFPAPDQELSDSLREDESAHLKVLHRERDDFLCPVVQSSVDDRFYKDMEGIDDLLLFVHFDGTDLDDLKRESLLLPRFAVWALIPFKIQYNIIHNYSPFGCLSLICSSDDPVNIRRSQTAFFQTDVSSGTIYAPHACVFPVRRFERSDILCTARLCFQSDTSGRDMIRTASSRMPAILLKSARDRSSAVLSMTADVSCSSPAGL